ncbi:Uncharacterized protein GY17_00001852 [Cryptosporidium hominis]|uniref:Uncharacterized protein n=1 Tax=Cryptosporidium hominis TaxID=237895 RepID=A0ABX5BE75_CRYHO|nr:Uncharacterized protein GY17_00001852 [Cryptosporidium hominis]|eukprot:PPS96375.1 Uncharacterized protein GY17_00001852 [Cryptosporidium hominis]
MLISLLRLATISSRACIPVEDVRAFFLENVFGSTFSLIVASSIILRVSSSDSLLRFRLEILNFEISKFIGFSNTLEIYL